MLGLAQQIGRADLGIDGVIGNDQRFGRTGEQINSDAAEQLPLGLGDESIARADQHVDRTDRLRADGHGGDRLHAAEHEDFVGARQMHAPQRSPGGLHPCRAERVATMRFTPATLAVSTLICAEATIGYLPPGT